MLIPPEEPRAMAWGDRGRGTATAGIKDQKQMQVSVVEESKGGCILAFF